MRIAATFVLLCCLGCALAQYGEDGPTPPKKPLQIPGARRVKLQQGGGPRAVSPPTQTTIINQRFRRPIPINKPRPSSEPIPELPVFTSGIRGSRPSSAAAIHLEQSDEPAALPIQQHTQLVHAQQYQPQVQIQQHKTEVKPVNEVHEKDEDVVQVIANLGAVSGYGAQSNLLTPTASSPTPAPSTPSAYLQQERQERQQERLQQQERQERQQERLQQERHDRQQERLQQQERQERQQERLQQQERQDRQQERLQQERQERQERQQERLQQQQQQQVQTIQYRPPQQIARSSQNIEQQIHQVITPVQYRPQKPIRLQKQQQQLVERNEYDINEARPVVKQRAQVAPKKAKPHGDYYDGRPKKPVAQVIRRYREETADGSIIWGFENDDGSFKEEMIGIDCITRGKYGYVDPDGVRREYTYETGIKCDEEAQQQQDQDILNTFVDYQENKLVLPSGKTIDLSSMGKKQARRPNLYRN